MIARTLPARTPEEIERLVRSLGSHRYVAGRLLLVHAFVFDALSGAGDGSAAVDSLREARVWAEAVLADGDIDRGSRDERLWRRASEREVAAALAVFWDTGDASEAARAKLAAQIEAISAPLPARDAPLFDESAEDEIFPLLIDAGWELLPLAALDAERHRGAIEAFGDPFAFECARFDETSADGAPPPLQELPGIGPHELLHGAEHGILRAPLVLWTEGSETYHDYVMRGVLRAAKLD
jgi:hypothetical protein